MADTIAFVPPPFFRFLPDRPFGFAPRAGCSPYRQPSQTDPLTVRRPPTHEEDSLHSCVRPKDMNGDGLLDAICRFDMPGTRFVCCNTQGMDRFVVTWGDTAQGSDGIKIAQSACR